MENLDKALESVGESIVAEVRKLAKKDNFHATDSLDKSISYKVKGNIVEISANKYIGALSGGINKKKFPNVYNLISKNRGRILHSDLDSLHLCAWKISGNALEREGFEKHLLRLQQGHAGNQQWQPMTTDCLSIMSGQGIKLTIPWRLR